jgi:hypothetical protein
MKKLCRNSAFPMAVAVGTAMSVALKDNAVGFTIGVAVFIMMNIAKRVKTQ